MAKAILSTPIEANTHATRFHAGSPFGDIAAMLVAMDRDGRLNDGEREALTRHASNASHSIPLMIRGLTVSLMDALLEGESDRSQIANAVWSIGTMTDALQGMQLLCADLRTAAGVTNHG